MKVIKISLILIIVLLLPLTSMGQTPVEEKVGVLITGWGLPAGLNFHYAWTSSDYPRVGDKTEYEGQPCKIGHSGEFPFQIHVGIIPWALHSGNLTPCDAASVGSETWELFYDFSGIYRYDDQANLYININPSVSPVDPATIPSETPIVPLSVLTDHTGSKLTYEPDPRDGSDYLDGWYRIGDFSNPYQNGINDLTEQGPAYYMRYIGHLLGPTSLPDAYLPPPSEQGLNHEVETLLYNDFGDRIDIRHGAYTGTKCDSTTGCEDINGNPVGDGDTIFPVHDDAAEQFSNEGFRKMLLARETTDFNLYALETMTGNYVKERLCELNTLNDTEINFTRQVGRTPEFNAMCVQNLQPYIEKYTPGTTIALVYVTRGLPWEITNTPDCIGNQYPFCKDVYFENAYLNYLSWKKAVKKAFGDRYNLVFTTDGSDSNALLTNLFTFSLETADLMGVTGEQVFYTTRDAIQLAKAQSIDKIIVVPAHWNYDNLDTIMRSKEENWLPMVSKADLANDIYEITHCETVDCDLTTDTGAAPCGRNPDVTRNYDHIVDCDDPSAVTEITFMPSFSNIYDKFAVAYYVVLRGTLERFGLYPEGLDASEVGAPDIGASQLITKLAGGTVTVNDPLNGAYSASITIPPDPYPAFPETFTCDGGEDELSPHPPDAADTYDCMWEDATINIGYLSSPPSMGSLPAVGPAVYFGPYRNFFNRDVTVTVPYDTTAAGTLPVRIYVYNHLTQGWESIDHEVIDAENGLITFKTQTLGLFQVAAGDEDGDAVVDTEDNCVEYYNPGQEDTYPPTGNDIGDLCDCEGNFDCDEDCDGSDAATFKIDFGRSIFFEPCTNTERCNGDFDCDSDCDGTDAAKFKQDFGRSQFSNPCPLCDEEFDWCTYL